MLTILLTMAIIGFLAYLIVTYIPMPEPFRQVIIVVLVIMVIIWLLNTVGSVGNLNLR